MFCLLGLGEVPDHPLVEVPAPQARVARRRDDLEGERLYIYIYRERERDVYIYIYIYREREI